MGFSLTTNDLISRTIRSVATENGVKILGDLLAFDDSDNESTGNWFTRKLKSWGGKLLSRGLEFLKNNVSFSAIWGFLVNTAQKLYNFNWNATDEQLKQQGRGRWLAVADAWGEFFGEATGTLLAAGLGFGVSMYIPVIGGKLLAFKTALKVLGEKGDDILDAGKDALRLTIEAAVGSLGTNTFIAARKWIRENAGNGLVPESLKEWGTGGEPFVIAEKVEETIESIPNDFARTFVESWYETTGEAFIEGGYIAARFLDDEWANQNVLAEGVLGGTREAALELDKGRGGGGSNEIARFADLPANLAISSITQLIQTHRLIHDRDLGYFTEPDDGRKVLQPYLRTCKITLRDVEKPPFIDPETNNAAGRHQITLKSLKPNLRWRDFKRALRNHRWGPWKIEATLESRVTMIIYAAEKEAGKTFLKGLISDLCEEDYIRVSATEEELDPRITKLAKFVYPEKALVTLKRERPDGTRKDLAGKKYEQEQIEFRLWTEDAPFGTPEFVTNFSAALPT